MIIDEHTRVSTIFQAINILEHILKTVDEYKKYRGFKSYKPKEGEHLYEFKEHYELQIFDECLNINLFFYTMFAHAEFEDKLFCNDQEVTTIKIRKIVKNLKNIVKNNGGSNAR